MSGPMAERARVGAVTANGIDFGILEAGAGPLALCLHGFPDSAHTWRHLLPRLATAGFHAVAPFMRGYAPTSVADDGCYHLGALVADAVALHEVLGGDDQAVLIGHDWGAETAYGAAAFAPERWRRIVTLAVPPAALDDTIFADYDQLKRFFYLFLFKTPLAERVVAARRMAFIDRLWADWSPGYDARVDRRHAKRCLRRPANLAAALSYYRAAEPRPEGVDVLRHEAEFAAAASVAPRPTLYLHGDRDGCIDARLVRGAGRHLGKGSAVEVVRQAGHFLHLERPELVNKRILAWLTTEVLGRRGGRSVG